MGLEEILKVGKNVLRASLLIGTLAFNVLNCDISNTKAEEAKAIQGICYSPFRDGQSPDYGIFPSEEQIKEDLSILSGVTPKIRTYGNDNILYDIPRLCSDAGIECYAGAWISSNDTTNQQAVQSLIQIANQNYSTTKSLIVGNEVLQRGDISETKLIEYISQLNAATNIPVTTAENWDVWLNHPDVANAVDYLLVHVHPYLADISVEDAPEYVIEKYNLVKQAFPEKEAVIGVGETGWPTAEKAGKAVPSEENQKIFLKEFLRLAGKNNVEYFIFEAFDEAWKRQNEGEVGAHWGLYYSDRTPKPAIKDLSQRLDDFREYSGVNLPWINYGWDLGKNPWGGSPGGFKANRERLIEDFSYLKSKGVKLARVFLFNDFRTGLEYNSEGNIINLDEYVNDDMQTLIDVANAHNIKLIPVLMDYMLADGVQWEGASMVGEHPEFITDAEKKNQLFENVLKPFIRRFGDNEVVYALEIMNEPEYASAVSQDMLKTFMKDLKALILEESPNALVTAGINRRCDLSLWPDLGNLVQFHYYDYMEDNCPLDYLASDISSEPVLIGELQSSGVKNKLDIALRNDYVGALFWSLNADYSNKLKTALRIVDMKAYYGFLNASYNFRTIADDFKNWMTSDDLDAPAEVSGLTARDTPNDNGSSIDISWNTNLEDDVDYYEIYRSIENIEDVIGMTRIGTTNTNSFTDSSVLDNTNYYYAVMAVDTSGNKYFLADDVGPVQPLDNITDGGNGGDEGGGGGGGCFIATAAYGTPTASEVKLLSQFKDEHLITNPAGKAFTKLYYRLSPSVAEKIKDSEPLKKAVRYALKPAIHIFDKINSP